MAAVTEDNKTIARYAAQVFGGHPSVTRFWDDNHKSWVDLLKSEDQPQKGVSSYATIGLSDWPLIQDGEEYPARLEMVGACGNQFGRFDNALATAAFCIINSKWFCFPGAIFPDVLRMHKCSRTMPHFLFVPPFLWDDKLQTMDLKGSKIAWLMAIPISETERRFAEKNGADKLQDLFVAHQIDVFDLERKSVV